MTDDSHQYLVPLLAINGTKLCIFSGSDSVTYELFVSNSTFESERLFFKVQKELSPFTTECLLADAIDSDVILVNSSKPFGVMLIDSEVLPNPHSGNRVMESVPSVSQMGKEFVLVTSSEAEVHVVGMYLKHLSRTEKIPTHELFIFLFRLLIISAESSDRLLFVVGMSVNFSHFEVIPQTTE